MQDLQKDAIIKIALHYILYFTSFFFIIILQFSFRSASHSMKKRKKKKKTNEQEFFGQNQKERLFVDDAQDTKQTCRIRLR